MKEQSTCSITGTCSGHGRARLLDGARRPPFPFRLSALPGWFFALAFFLLPWPPPSWGAVKMEPVTYRHGDTELRGWLAWDDSVEGKRPGVMIVPEWWGLNGYISKRATEIASLGYVVLAADVYGSGRTTNDPAEAKALSQQLLKGDRSVLRDRESAGLTVLMNHPLVDPKRVAAMGYCFGGTAVLELARSGAPLAGAVCFHGRLDTPSSRSNRPIKAKILVLNGADDPNVPLKQIGAFEDEMRSQKADWQLISYGSAVHAFTNPASGSNPSTGVAYNEKADKRSWEHMKLFYSEIFAPPPTGE
jgi:dienelactone hydrolase